METAFGFNIVLRFVLPGAVCVFGLLIALDAASFWTLGKSILRTLDASKFAIPVAAVLIPTCFALGVVLNALSFKLGYKVLDWLYRRRNPSIKKLEEAIYGGHIDRLHAVYADKVGDTERKSLYAILWKNKRAIHWATYDREALEKLDEKYSPYIDFQMGLSISIGLTAFTFPFWFYLAKYEQKQKPWVPWKTIP